MPENKTFVINDRRKFTADGDIRPDAPRSEAEPQQASPTSEHTPEQTGTQPSPDTRPHADPIPFPSRDQSAAAPEPVSAPHEPAASAADAAEDPEHLMPPPPTAEQTEQANRAYAATIDRLDTAIRATNPGMERIPEMTFERLVQSLYMQALLQLGGAAEPGQTPQVDLLGARQTVDMLAIVAEKTRNNLTPQEDKLVQSALFELRMGFLEITQALSRSAARQPGAPGGPAGPGGGMPPGGPSLIR